MPIDKHHPIRRSQGGKDTMQVPHEKHMIGHSSPDQFIREFGIDEYHRFLPRIKSKHEYWNKLKELKDE